MGVQTKNELARRLSLNPGSLLRYTRESWFPDKGPGGWDVMACWEAINAHRRKPLPHPSRVAQPVERGTVNPVAGGSTPPPAVSVSREREVRLEGADLGDVAAKLEAKQEFIVDRLLELADSENPNAAIGALNQLVKLVFGKRVLVEKRGEGGEIEADPAAVKQIMENLQKHFGKPSRTPAP